MRNVESDGNRIRYTKNVSAVSGVSGIPNFMLKCLSWSGDNFEKPEIK